MNKNKLLSDISVSTAQVILNQLSGIIVFFIISRYLDKAALGHINWALAVLMVVFSILGFGLEHVAVRKAATGADLGLLLQSYLIHVLVTGMGFLGLTWLIESTVPSLRADGHLFLLLAISQCLSFLAIPFRQIVNGLEKFRALFVMSSCANICKAGLLLILALMQQVSLSLIVEVYILASAAELLACVIIYKVQLRLPIVPGYDWKRYLGFLKEALPQLGITVFNTAVQRMDWILLGILSTAVVVAEYSFTNKLFELATLPLLIIAPVIFPKIAKLFGNISQKDSVVKMDYLKVLVRLEIIVAVFVAMAVNICWKDIIDPLTDNKYGASTRQIIFVMSFAMPLIYINNIFWSILFSQEKMKTLLMIFLATFLMNMVADILLIPFYGAAGAALGFVLALGMQTILYFRQVPSQDIKRGAFHLFPVIGIALAAGFVSQYLFDFFVWQLLTGTGIYFSLLVITRQFLHADWQKIKKILKPDHSINQIHAA
jgi:O-antigen/teichoic acid export membrane protein